MKIAYIQLQAQNEQVKHNWKTVKETIVTAGNTHDMIVLPKCVYTTYLSDQTKEKGKALHSFINEVRSLCKQTNTHIVFGYVNGDRNVASLINGHGEEIARQERSTSNQFNRATVKLENNVAIAETEYGKIALIGFRNARFPELIRSAAVENVKLVICLAHLTTAEPFGFSTDGLTHAQCNFMFRTRARENNVWFVVFYHWGALCGPAPTDCQLAIYTPDGALASQLPSENDTILSAEIPTTSSGGIICENNEPVPVRLPELYSLLNKETYELPIYKILSESINPESFTPYITVSCYNEHPFNFRELIHQLKEVNPNLIILPASGQTIENTAPYQNELGLEQLLILSDSTTEGIRSRILAKKRIYGEYRTAHNGISKTEHTFPYVVNSPFGNIGIIHEGEALIPEAVRCVMLAGADFIIWSHGMSLEDSLPLAQTRAAENRIFVAGVYSSVLPASAPSGASFIIDPNGNVITVTSVTEPNHTTGLFCSLLNARIKSIIPGTHVVFNRNPKNYGRLVTYETKKV